jgi:hypothetical protein
MAGAPAARGPTARAGPGPGKRAAPRETPHEKSARRAIGSSREDSAIRGRSAHAGRPGQRLRPSGRRAWGCDSRETGARISRWALDPASTRPLPGCTKNVLHFFGRPTPREEVRAQSPRRRRRSPRRPASSGVSPEPSEKCRAFFPTPRPRSKNVAQIFGAARSVSRTAGSGARAATPPRICPHPGRRGPPRAKPRAHPERGDRTRSKNGRPPPHFSGAGSVGAADRALSMPTSAR